MNRRVLVLMLVIRLSQWQSARAYEDEPINYSKAVPQNRLTRLQTQLDAGTAKLEFDQSLGYLRSVLQLLEIPVSSQVLTFSQTSLQRPKISPKTPRAIYFTDDAYVGYVQEGLLEIAMGDPKLGTVFYTLDQQASDKPKFVRQTNRCLTCHGALKTRNVPGVQVRSVFVDQEGQPIVSLGSFRVDHTTPLSQRWGGWYVTGNHGNQKHFGNLVVENAKRREEIDVSIGQNVTDLSQRFDVSRYLTPHSDLVALMVLEHQVDAQNLLTRASFEARAVRYAVEQAEKIGQAELTTAIRKGQARLKAAADSLVQYFLFCGEAPLTDPLCGTSSFAQEFSEQGPRDNRGRSLRELDLTRRLLKYPCSYLIYQPAFDQMPLEIRSRVLNQMWEVLSGEETAPQFKHLSAEDRQAIREILIDTKPEFAKLASHALALQPPTKADSR